MKNIIDLTNKLIRIPSVAGNEKALEEALDICGKILEEYPFKKFKKNGSQSRLYFNTKQVPEKFRLILNAHLDVVPGKSEQFKPFLKGDKLFGRGAQDMKSAAAVFVLLFSKIAKNIPYPIGLQLVTDEEIGGFLGTGFQIDRGVSSEFIIAGESTNMLINNQAKGVLWVEFVIKGKSAHSAYLWNGKNAIVRTNSLIEKLLRNFPIPADEQWKTTCNIAKIKTDNDAVNKVPVSCRLTVDIRYIPNDEARVKKIIKSLSNYFTTFRYLEKGDASFTRGDNPNIQTLQNLIRGNRKSGDFIKKHGSSDIRFYNARGISGITFGPAGGGLHSDNEWVSIKSLSEYKNVMEIFLKKLER